MTPGPEPGKEGIGRPDLPGIRPEGPLGISRRITWILLLALALRGLATWRFDPVAFDSAVYFEMADLIRAGRWSEALAYDFPPLYPVLLAAAQWLPVSAENACLMITLVFDLLVLFLIVGIARTATGEGAAWGAAFLWAIHPLAIRLGAHALTDAPTAFFAALAPLAGRPVIASPYIMHISAEPGSIPLPKKKSTSSLVRSLMPAPEDVTKSQGVAQPSGVPATR